MARTIAILLLLFAALALLTACNDESDFLFEDAEPEATGTPPFEQRTPEPSPEGSPLAVGATPVTAFEIEVEETVIRRSEPSREGTVEGSLDPDDKASVVAHVPGEEVEANNDIWYQLEDGTFVYSGVVEVVEQGAEAEETAEAGETPEVQETPEAEETPEVEETAVAEE